MTTVYHQDLGGEGEKGEKRRENEKSIGQRSERREREDKGVKMSENEGDIKDRKGEEHYKIRNTEEKQCKYLPNELLNLCLYTGIPASLVKNFTIARTLSPACVTASRAPTTGFTPNPRKLNCKKCEKV